MREVITKVYCDVCEEEVKETEYSLFKYWVGTSSDPHGKRHNDYREFDICNMCKFFITHPDELINQDQLKMVKHVFKNKGRKI